MHQKSKKIAKVVTFGCQMNERDSETISGFLVASGYELDHNTEDPDLVIFITCCVRENAENRAFGNLGYMKHYKETNPNTIIGICGCMVQQSSILDHIKNNMKFVDLVFGTHNIHRLPELLARVHEGHRAIEVLDESDGIHEGMPAVRVSNTKAYVNIMYGCDNFCTYCIVPYVRGRERSRVVSSIIQECRELAEAGFCEITLLGQNVNSYGKNLVQNDNDIIDFSYLLKQVDKVDGIKRIRYATSHPKDFSQKLIDTVRESSKIANNFHLPFQAGSDRILRAMNRGYTAEQYMDIIERLRESMPNCAVTTDILVGFPGESDDDFARTMDLVKAVRFDSAFTFIYSRREGTKAYDMDNQVPEEVKHERIKVLIETQNSINLEKNQEALGKTVEVMVEGPSERDSSVYAGRSLENKMVHWTPRTACNEGDIVNVKVNEANIWTLIGEEI